MGTTSLAHDNKNSLHDKSSLVSLEMKKWIAIILDAIVIAST
jgi:hypothetical protein